MFAGAPGAVRDIVTLNAAAALLALEGPSGDDLVAQLAPRVERARVALDDGSVTRKLDDWIAATRAAAG